MQNEKKIKKDFIKRLIIFTIKVVKFTDKIKNVRNLWSISDQVIRSASSIGANIIEAKAASSKKDYLKFFEIALKSANETIYWLIVLKECVQEEFKSELNLIYAEANEISKIVGASVLTLKGKKDNSESPDFKF